jgi:hypothetical protein
VNLDWARLPAKSFSHLFVFQNTTAGWKRRAQQCCAPTEDLSRDRLLIWLFVVGRNFCDIADVGDIADGARRSAGIFDHAVKGGFGVFIDSADGGNQTGIEKGFDTCAELLGGLFGGASDIVDHCAAAIFAGGATFGVESGEGGADALGGFGDSQIDLDLSLTAELFESGAGSAVQERAGFGDAGVELGGGFAGDHTRGFHHANELAIGDAVGGGFKLFGGLAERFAKPSACLRLDFASGFFDEFLRLREIALHLRGKFFQALRDFFGLRTVSVVLLFPTALDLAESRFEMAEDFFARRTNQRFHALLGKFTQLLKISLADAFDPGEGCVDGLIEMIGQRVLHDFFRGSLQLALHGGDELVDRDSHAFRF